jgi:cyclophilin family peptidyl-prolyl cis-trans isomerase
MRVRHNVPVGSASWRPTIACCAAVGALVLAGCGSDAGNAVGTSGETSDAAAPRGESLDPQHPVVEIGTNLGAIRVRLDAVNAPGTVRNFLNYVSDGFYADTLFHYVDAGNIIVGGGYNVDGQPKMAGTPVRNEAHNGLKNVRGTIAMARDAAAGIDSATSQFFINLADSPSFDHRGDGADEYGYCVFGEVVTGLDVAEQISRSPTRDQGGDLAQTPMPPVVIQSIEVVE